MNHHRAIVFDLDDTLYRVRRYSLSGFRAVALELGRRGHDPRVVFGTLQAAYRHGAGARAFQQLEAQIGADHGLDLIEVYRSHEPSLRLPRESGRALVRLRQTWKVGVLTNGPPDQQRRKVAALGLSDLVDVVVYAHEHSEVGKPEAVAFATVLSALAVPARRAVMVGDDPQRDIAGARAVGCATVRVVRPGRIVNEGEEADAVVGGFEQIEDVARRLLAARDDHGV